MAEVRPVAVLADQAGVASDAALALLATEVCGCHLEEGEGADGDERLPDAVQDAMVHTLAPGRNRANVLSGSRPDDVRAHRRTHRGSAGAPQAAAATGRTTVRLRAPVTGRASGAGLATATVTRCACGVKLNGLRAKRAATRYVPIIHRKKTTARAPPGPKIDSPVAATRAPKTEIPMPIAAT